MTFNQVTIDRDLEQMRVQLAELDSHLAQFNKTRLHLLKEVDKIKTDRRWFRRVDEMKPVLKLMDGFLDDIKLLMEKLGAMTIH